MEKKIIIKRLDALRSAMMGQKIDYYLIPNGDFHGSEYVSDYFKVREFFSGFTGSNGTLLVWQTGAGLWTDGRYFIQAQMELEGTGIELFRMFIPGVPTIREYLLEKMAPGQVLGFDGRVVSAKAGLEYEKALKEKNITVFWNQDLCDAIWDDRPGFPKGKIMELPISLTGSTVEEKLKRVRLKINQLGATEIFLSKLDDIMWLFNIRGEDVACNPVAMSYAYISFQEAVLFLQKEGTDASLLSFLEKSGVQVMEYQELVSFVESKSFEKVILDLRYIHFSLYGLLKKKAQIIDKPNPTEELKAVKNAVEIANMKDIYLKDSVAVTKFIFWLKKNIGKIDIDEISAAKYLDDLRKQIPEFLDLSFPTISAYRENAAMMHYEASEASFSRLCHSGMLLVDSGGQYLGGTTDVTRTIVLGPISEEEKKHYTLTAMGMLQLQNAIFPKGCTGRNLDILARQPLWNIGIDYLCGTGHGIGYILNVHEGPQSIRWRYNKEAEETVLEAGMVVTDEPGVYVEGSHGIRLENVLLTVSVKESEYGQFLGFEPLTYVPLDPEAIEEKYLSKDAKSLLADYQKKVYSKISPFLSEEERTWLAMCTIQNGKGSN